MFHARAEERVLTMLFFSAGAHYLSVMTLMSYVSRVCLPQKFKVGIDFLTTLALHFFFFITFCREGKPVRGLRSPKDSSGVFLFSSSV